MCNQVSSWFANVSPEYAMSTLGAVLIMHLLCASKESNIQTFRESVAVFMDCYFFDFL